MGRSLASLFVVLSLFGGAAGRSWAALPVVSAQRVGGSQTSTRGRGPETRRGGTLYVGSYTEAGTRIFSIKADRRGRLGRQTIFDFKPGRLGGFVRNPRKGVLYCFGSYGKRSAIWSFGLRRDGSVERKLDGPIECDYGKLLVHPNGRYLYNVFPSGFSVRFKLRGDGGIDVKSAYPAQRNWWSGEISSDWSPDGRFLYLAVNDSLMDAQMGYICVARYRPSDGVLKVVPGTTEDFGEVGASSIQISADGRSALVLCLNDKLVKYRRDPKSGRLTRVSDLRQPFPDAQIRSAIQSSSGNVYAAMWTMIVDFGKIGAANLSDRVVYTGDSINEMELGPGDSCVYALQAKDQSRFSVRTIPLHGGEVTSTMFSGDACGFTFSRE